MNFKKLVAWEQATIIANEAVDVAKTLEDSDDATMDATAAAWKRAAELDRIARRLFISGTNETLDRKKPEWAWELYVGDLTASDFKNDFGDVDEYVSTHPACADLNETQRATLARKMRDYLDEAMLNDFNWVGSRHHY